MTPNFNNYDLNFQLSNLIKDYNSMNQQKEIYSIISI